MRNVSTPSQTASLRFGSEQITIWPYGFRRRWSRWSFPASALLCGFLAILDAIPLDSPQHIRPTQWFDFLFGLFCFAMAAFWIHALRSSPPFVRFDDDQIEFRAAIGGRTYALHHDEILDIGFVFGNLRIDLREGQTQTIPIGSTPPSLHARLRKTVYQWATAHSISVHE